MFPSLSVYLWLGVIAGVLGVIFKVAESIKGDRLSIQSEFNPGANAIVIVVKFYILLWSIHLLSNI